MEAASRRLKQVQTIFLESAEAKWRHVLVLPDSAHVSVLEPAPGSPAGSPSKLAIDGKVVLGYRPLPRELALVISALGTPFEKDNPTPRYPVLEFYTAVDDGTSLLSISDFWACIYTLWTLLHTQEHIPVVFSASLPNASELSDYLLLSSLGRKALDPTITDAIFLDRGAFWSGAGIGPAWNVLRGWMRDPWYAARAASFPLTQSFTRTSTVIAQHPLRPPKPAPGSCIYQRYCTPVGQMLTFHAFDPDSEAHMNAFHKWQNDERVARGWNERGTMEHHREYIKKVFADPLALPFLMSWDGELMGYGEFVWIKENHVAPYVPGGAWDHDRGLHVLVGEDKFRGQVYSQAWFRSVTHYMFLSDPRTVRIVGEPKRNNPAIIKTSCDAGMHLETSFYFPYKYSVITMNLRERFFKEDLLT